MREAIEAIDHDGFLRSFNAENPRSRILLATGFMEELLRIGILSRPNDNKSSITLFGPDSNKSLAELASFSHALGHIGSLEKATIDKLRRIRNKIAHSWALDFGNPHIQKLASEIPIVKLINDESSETHQTAFLRTDYAAVSLIEIFSNRLRSGQIPTAFASMITINVQDGTRDVKWELA